MKKINNLKRTLFYLISILMVVFLIYINLPRFPLPDSSPNPNGYIHGIMSDFSSLLEDYINNKHKAPQTPSDLLEFAKKSLYVDVKNYFLDIKDNRYKSKFGKPLSLKELKKRPTNKVNQIKIIQASDDVAIAYYVEQKIINNKRKLFTYNVYCIVKPDKFKVTDKGISIVTGEIETD